MEVVNALAGDVDYVADVDATHEAAPPPPMEASQVASQATRGFASSSSAAVVAPVVPPVKEESWLRRHAHLALGAMTIMAPKFSDVGSKAGGKGVISGPISAVHNQHVRFNPETRSFEGLPPEWEGLLKRQFGLEPSQVEAVVVPGYVSRIPTVLILMRDYLRKENAFQIEGLFRIAADAEECVFVKKALNEGAFVRCDDVHCISNLLKVWFRDLPRAILDPIDTAHIDAVTTDAEAAAIVEMLEEPHKSIFLWIIDLCVECSSQADVNKMTGKNLAIVFGPNLFSPSMADPMASLRFSQKVAQFMDKEISWRANELKAQNESQEAQSV
jgi:hypothetical protein